jgi:molybdate transport system substrate-binding protein
MNPQIRTVGPSALRIRTSHSSFSVLMALVPAFEQSTGIEVAIEADSAQTMLARLKGGESGDIVILGDAMVEELQALGIAAPRAYPFARARVGVAVKAGAPRPDISTVEAFKRSMLAARSIAHTVNGASGRYVPVLMERLGIAAAMKAKTVTRPGGYIARVVAAGEAEIAIQQIVELMAVPGVDLVGPLPDEIQKTFTTLAAVMCASTRAAEAESLLGFLTAPGNAETFRAKGLELAGS